jgi:hypothetical protein
MPSPRQTTLLEPAPKIEASAIFSPCRRYRHELRREWDLMRRLIGFVHRWDFGGFVVVNLYDWISTNPAGIGSCEEHVSPENHVHLASMLREVDRVVIGPPTRDGHPRHPLRLAYCCKLEPMD